MKFLMNDEDDDDVVSCFCRCCTTIFIWLRSIDGGVGTIDDDDDRRVAVVGCQLLVGSRLMVVSQ